MQTYHLTRHTCTHTSHKTTKNIFTTTCLTELKHKIKNQYSLTYCLPQQQTLTKLWNSLPSAQHIHSASAWLTKHNKPLLPASLQHGDEPPFTRLQTFFMVSRQEWERQKGLKPVHGVYTQHFRNFFSNANSVSLPSRQLWNFQSSMAHPFFEQEVVVEQPYNATALNAPSFLGMTLEANDSLAYGTCPATCGTSRKACAETPRAHSLNTVD